MTISALFVWHVSYYTQRNASKKPMAYVHANLKEITGPGARLNTLYFTNGCKIRLPLFDQFNGNLPWRAGDDNYPTRLDPGFKKTQND